MFSARFFVTPVMLLATLFSLAFSVACEKKKSSPQAEADKIIEETLDEGVEKLNLAQEVIGDLENDFGISIAIVASNPRRRTSPELQVSPFNYNWRRLSRERRHEAKRKLAEYDSLASRILEIDLKKQIYLRIEDKANVERMRETVRAYQESVKDFETRMGGENFEPDSKYESEPAYRRQYDAKKESKVKKSV